MPLRLSPAGTKRYMEKMAESLRGDFFADDSMVSAMFSATIAGAPGQSLAQIPAFGADLEETCSRGRPHATLMANGRTRFRVLRNFRSS